MLGQGTDFSSNRHATASLITEFQVPVRHPDLDLCFEDGNVAILTGHYYFLVHRGLLCRHSEVFRDLIHGMSANQSSLLEGRPILQLSHSPDEMSHLLRALYGPSMHIDESDFLAISALLRLSTAYRIGALRAEVLRRFACSWPTSLSEWEAREKRATGADGIYAPRPTLPHPILVIDLAREINAPELIPSAFYDLSRYLPSQLAGGYTDPQTSVTRELSSDDLRKVFRGKEQAARYFSTFIVKELEGRTPSAWCSNRNEIQPFRKRACQIAFEAITFALIRDVNGMVLNRNSDPLFAIADSLALQTRDDLPGNENNAAHRACEACRLEYGAVIEAVRLDFWRKIPGWFELEQPHSWGL